MENQKPQSRKEDTDMSWREGLTGRTLDIAAYTGPRLRILAGPGTGKSFALMRRLARLLEEGVDPSRILAVTFTRTAAADLRKDIDQLGVSGCHDVEVTTLHGLCFGVLQQGAVLRMTGRNPRTLLEFEKRGLLYDLTDPAYGGLREKKARLRAYEADWARLQHDEPGWPPAPLDRQFQAEVTSWLKFHRAMLVGEIVPATLAHLRGTPLSSQLTRFDHVLVDEYQDLNRAEQELVAMLASNAHITIVGDDDQSIYSFKYAHPEGILTYEQTYPDTQSEQLTICRRCPQTVVHMARSLIQMNRERYPKVLEPKPDNPPGRVYIAQWLTLDDEVRGVASAIEHLVKERKWPAGRILALSPRRLIGYKLREELHNRGIRARSLFHEDVLDNDEARERFVLLNLLARPDDSVALRTWLGLGSSGYLAGSYRHLRERCEQTGMGLRDALDEYLRTGGLPHGGSLLERYRNLQEQLTGLSGLAGGQLIGRLIPNPTDDTAELRDLALLIAETHPDPVALFHELWRSISQPDPVPEGADVRIMSIHSSKGLTADAVFVMGCIEGLLPDYIEGLTPNELARHEEEQRRLLYVALTRTTDILFLSYPYTMGGGLAARTRAQLHGPSRRINGQWSKHTQTSRFLTQLGPHAPRALDGSSALRAFVETV